MKDYKLLICVGYSPLFMLGLFMFEDFYALIANNILFIFILFISLLSMKNKNIFLSKIILNNWEKSFSFEKNLSLKNIMEMVFILIFISNFLSLFPNIFPLFALINFAMILSVSFWLGSIFINMFYYLKNIFINLTPSSTPLMLMSFMVLIELTSQIIRPLTLLVRLSINLTVGHLILSLLSYFSFSSVLFQIPFFLLEVMVAFIQAYVFTLLIYLYFSE